MINGLPHPLIAPTPQPAQPTPPLNQREQTPNPPSALNPPKQDQAKPSGQPPAASGALNSLLRLRLDPQNPPSTTPVQKFADAVVKNADREQANSLANRLMDQQQAIDSGKSTHRKDIATVQPESTFGQIWAKFAQAVESEPFKSYAEKNNIDLDDMVIHPNGTITNLSGKEPRTWDANASAESKAATAAVIAAAKDLVGPYQDALIPPVGISYLGYTEDLTSIATVAQFYGLPLDTTNSDAIMATIGHLLREQTFPSLSSNDPRDEPLKQLQQAAVQHIEQLEEGPLNELLAAFKTNGNAARVRSADVALQALCAQALATLIPGMGKHESPLMLDNLPEASSFSLTRKKILATLSGAAFKDFAQRNGIDPTSVRINPFTGDLTAKVNGADTTFTKQDDSGWSAIWPTSTFVVIPEQADSSTVVSYPFTGPASLEQVMGFYKESIPAQHRVPEHQWEEKNRQSLLAKIKQLNSGQGFPSKGNRQLSLAVTKLNAPLSPLEKLAQAVKESKSKPQ